MGVLGQTEKCFIGAALRPSAIYIGSKAPAPLNSIRRYLCCTPTETTARAISKKPSQAATPRISLKNRTRKYNNTALFVGGCWVSLTGRFHLPSAAGWAECTVAGPGRVRRHAVQFSERLPTPLMGHARVALFGVPTRLPSTQSNNAQQRAMSRCQPHTCRTS